jgi:protein-disulfide isomerase
MFRRLHARRLAPFAGAALLAALSGAPRLVLRAQAPQTQDDLDARFLDAWKLQKREVIAVPPARAKLVVVKFNDWMCPGCREAAEMLKPVLAKYSAMPGALQYVEKDWPWNANCNPATAQTFLGHEASCDAAVAVRLASDRGKRETMAGWLFANQPETDEARKTMPARVRAKVAELLAVKDFNAAYALRIPDVRKDVAAGQALGIRSTPTYFINGIRAVNADLSTIPVHFFELALKYEYEKK